VKISEDIIWHLVRSIRAKAEELPSCWGVLFLASLPVRRKDTQTCADHTRTLVCDIRFLLSWVLKLRSTGNDALWLDG
jgi:hypothetical protein